MRLNDVLKRFTLISGLESEQVSVWTALCIDACQQIKRMLLPDVEMTEENSRRLSNCAAALAYYKFSFYAQDADVRSFTAGSVNVSMAHTIMERAEKIWQQEQLDASDLITVPGDFSFRGVRI